MNSRLRNIFFCTGLVAVIIMCLTFKVSFSTLWMDICKAGYWLVAILMLWAVLYLMNALSWMVILKGSGDCPIPYWRLAKITISGFALNSATPIGLLGGEPYRIMELQPYVGIERASSSVVLFSMMHVLSHFCYWTSSVFVYLGLCAVEYHRLDAYMAVILTVMLAFCLSAIYLFSKGYKNGMVVKFIHLVSMIPGLKRWAIDFKERNKENLYRIDSQISALHKQSKRAFFMSFGLEFLGRISMSFEIFFIMLICGVGGDNYLLTFIDAYLILAFTSLFANMLSFIPMQLGGREGGFAMSVAQLGMTGEIGLFISIICRVRELFWTSIGLALMKIKN